MVLYAFDAIRQPKVQGYQRPSRIAQRSVMQRFYALENLFGYPQPSSAFILTVEEFLARFATVKLITDSPNPEALVAGWSGEWEDAMPL
jgi:hypothetical protein